MNNGINKLPGGLKLPDGLRPAGEPPRPAPGSVAERPSFKKVMSELVKDVDNIHKTAEKATEMLVTGELEDVHQVVVAMEEAQISFRLMMQVRNKMVEAYKEVMKMQV